MEHIIGVKYPAVCVLAVHKNFIEVVEEITLCDKRSAAPILLDLGSRYKSTGSRPTQEPCIVIECNGSSDIIQYDLAKLGWSHFHVNRSERLGWQTTGKTRNLAIDVLLSLVNQGKLLLSASLKLAFDGMKKNEARQRIELSDSLMAVAIAVTSLELSSV